MKYNIKGFVVNNVPECAIEDVEQKGFAIVARFVDDELWFYGTYPIEKAEIVAKEVSGWVLVVGD